MEAPRFISCPPDKEIENASNTMRVFWPHPRVVDNSGIPPTIRASRRSGQVFAVPGIYHVMYNAQDASGNIATCSFVLTLKSKSISFSFNRRKNETTLSTIRKAQNTNINNYTNLDKTTTAVNNKQETNNKQTNTQTIKQQQRKRVL